MRKKKLAPLPTSEVPSHGRFTAICTPCRERFTGGHWVDSALDSPQLQNRTAPKQESVPPEPSRNLSRQWGDLMIPADLLPTYSTAKDLTGSVCAGSRGLEKVFEDDWTSH